MRKFRASLEPFGKVSNACSYPANTIQATRKLTSTAGRTSRVVLAYVIPWIKKASIALYTAPRAYRLTPKGGGEGM
jgi:hypothetical protein